MSEAKIKISAESSFMPPPQKKKKKKKIKSVKGKLNVDELMNIGWEDNLQLYNFTHTHTQTQSAHTHTHTSVHTHTHTHTPAVVLATHMFHNMHYPSSVIL